MKSTKVWAAAVLMVSGMLGAPGCAATAGGDASSEDGSDAVQAGGQEMTLEQSDGAADEVADGSGDDSDDVADIDGTGEAEQGLIDGSTAESADAMQRDGRHGDYGRCRRVCYRRFDDCRRYGNRYPRHSGSCRRQLDRCVDSCRRHPSAY